MNNVKKLNNCRTELLNGNTVFKHFFGTTF
jgi:hypothetical protein